MSGAGAGSIGIEWAAGRIPRCRAIAVERDPDRAKRIAANAAQLGVPGLRVRARARRRRRWPTCRGRTRSSSAAGPTTRVLDACWSALRPGGRLVVHAVTLETEAVITAALARAAAATLTRIAVEHLRADRRLPPAGSRPGPSCSGA